MLWGVLAWLEDNFDWAVTLVAAAAGAWNFWFVGPALAERGFPAEARLAAWGGLLTLAGSVLFFLLLQLLGYFRPM
ncbi:MAG: hypothetical protein NUV99_02835 [Clostridia bacterium]|jgi:hypothetical protein|nr:hypothetical protein [Clostridia bacterium]